MTNTLIFYGYTPDRRRWECQPSVEAMERIEQAGYAVHWHPCRERMDYANGLRDVWRHDGPLAIIEHDMVVPVGALDALFACQHPICAYAYWIALGVSGRRPMLSACVERDGEKLGGHTRVMQGEPGAGYAGIGCCKLSQSTRKAMALPAVVTWTDVEHEVNKAVSIAGQWHLHWPVIEHKHGFMTEALSERSRASERHGIQPNRGPGASGEHATAAQQRSGDRERSAATIP